MWSRLDYGSQSCHLETRYSIVHACACAPSAINLFPGRLISLGASESAGRRLIAARLQRDGALSSDNRARGFSHREKCKPLITHAPLIQFSLRFLAPYYVLALYRSRFIPRMRSRNTEDRFTFAREFNGALSNIRIFDAQAASFGGCLEGWIKERENITLSAYTKLRLTRELGGILISHFEIMLYLAISRSLERDSHILPIRSDELD
jgi:hypothetical protein